MKFRCPKCNEKITFPDSYYESIVKCPNCYSQYVPKDFKVVVVEKSSPAGPFLQIVGCLAIISGFCFGFIIPEQPSEIFKILTMGFAGLQVLFGVLLIGIGTLINHLTKQKFTGK